MLINDHFGFMTEVPWGADIQEIRRLFGTGSRSETTQNNVVVGVGLSIGQDRILPDSRKFSGTEVFISTVFDGDERLKAVSYDVQDVRALDFDSFGSLILELKLKLDGLFGEADPESLCIGLQDKPPDFYARWDHTNGTVIIRANKDSDRIRIRAVPPGASLTETLMG